MYPLDQENLLEDDVIEFVHYYLDLNKTYMNALGFADVYKNLQEYGYVKDLIKKLKTCKDSKLFYDALNEFEAKLPYGKNLISLNNLTDRCAYLYDKIALLRIDAEAEYSDASKVVRKKQRELDSEYEEIFPVAKKYKDCVGELKAYANAMSDPKKLIAVYKADTSGISINDFKEKVKQAYARMLENVKRARTECFSKIKDYYIKFHENLLIQKKLETGICI